MSNVDHDDAVPATVPTRIASASTRVVRLRDTHLAVDTIGDGPAVMLVHGFPHTRAIWSSVAPRLAAQGFHVIAPDLRGFGDSGRPRHGYDASTVALDLIQLLDELGIGAVHMVGMDLGATPAFTMAATYADRIATLTVSEAVLGGLSGAETFLRTPPWWFGFHQAPDALAEKVVVGAEDTYVRFFLGLGTLCNPDEDLIASIADTYRGHDALRAAFAHYRAMPENAAWTARWARTHRLGMPTLAIGGGVVADTTARQLAGVADHLTTCHITDAAHIIALDQPEQFARAVVQHANQSTTSRDSGTGTP
ncbi:alpha/beta hydrolase [Gordonia sp. ABSL11-1]|uniref:alpha/beta fold hydrolase n=1 Tax=Gordonia sp. ABSL11-1 TaxID=3053924 RepID=UPI0025738D14|nr:alpha/beta hydrolase [Gordonia sp. ABSL11-1]MDL9948109.1 alpha/beta hydrolase [Gordonia sp. ABSL11-1]